MIYHLIGVTRNVAWSDAGGAQMFSRGLMVLFARGVAVEFRQPEF
jgi:hypothetical protein